MYYATNLFSNTILKVLAKFARLAWFSPALKYVRYNTLSYGNHIHHKMIMTMREIILKLPYNYRPHPKSQKSPKGQISSRCPTTQSRFYVIFVYDCINIFLHKITQTWSRQISVSTSISSLHLPKYYLKHLVVITKFKHTLANNWNTTQTNTCLNVRTIHLNLTIIKILVRIYVY